VSKSARAVASSEYKQKYAIVLQELSKGPKLNQHAKMHCSIHRM